MSTGNVNLISTTTSEEMNVNKKQFKAEHQKWRLFMRALNNTYHGQGSIGDELSPVSYQATDATILMWSIYHREVPCSVRYSIDNKNGGNSIGHYYKLDSSLSRSQFKSRVALNMELPSSFIRDSIEF